MVEGLWVDGRGTLQGVSGLGIQVGCNSDQGLGMRVAGLGVEAQGNPARPVLKNEGLESRV